MSNGQVEGLFIKAERRMPMVEKNELTVIQGFGIEGDVNANKISPRQILLAERGVLEAHELPLGGIRENIDCSNLDLTLLTSGTEIAIGNNARIRITFPCEACNFIASLHVPNPKHLVENRGVLGVILQDGIIRRGDEITILGKNFTEVPTGISERFVWFVNQIPAGKVIDYKSLIKGIGGSSSYLRAIPGFIKRGKEKNPSLHIHRIVDSYGALISSVKDQKDLLQDEQIEVSEEKVNLTNYLWDSSQVYFE